MASIGDVWLVDFGEPYPGEPARHRPAVVIGPPGSFGPRFPYAIVVPMTTSARGLSLHVEVEPSAATGLHDVSYVQCELIRSVSRRRMVTRLGEVDDVARAAITEIVRVLLDH